MNKLASSIRKAVGGHVVAGVVAICASTGMIGAAHGAVVNSGPVNIVISDDTNGIYLNVVTGANSAPPAPAGWDINLYSAVTGQFHLWGWNTNTFFNPGAVIGGNYNLPRGTVIQGLPTAFFRPGGSINAGVNFTLNSTENFIGFRFQNEANANQIHFGWAQLSFGPTTGTRSIIAYAYDDVADTAITIPLGASAPQFTYSPAAGGPVNFTGGTLVGSIGTASISAAIATPGSGAGAAATTTTTCTAPGGPFSGFGQTVTAVGAAGSTTGGPLSGSCTLGASQVVVTMTCSEDQGGTPVSRTFDLTCPAGTVAAAPSVPVPAFGNPARILLALSALLMGMVTLALRARRG